MKQFKYILPILAGIIMVGGIIWSASSFPTAKDSLPTVAYGDVITETIWNNIVNAVNAIQDTVGITNSADTASHDYLIRNSTSSLYTLNKTDSGFIVGDGTKYVLETGATARTSMGLGTMATEAASSYLSLTTWFATTSHSLISSLPALSITESQISNLGNYLTWANATSSYLQLTNFYSTTTLEIAESGNLYYTDARVASYLNTTNTISINIEGNADTATALASNPTDCTSGQYANAIAASGNLTCQAIPNTDLPSHYPSFTYSTTTSWDTTTTIPLGPAYIAETWNGAQCFTNTGTLKCQLGDGTNWMNLINASTTIGIVALTTNNTFTAGEKRYVKCGEAASSPLSISCTIDKEY